MQRAKDTFLIALRDGLVTLNPARTVVVRGALRPAVLADENELAMVEGDPADCFSLEWTSNARDLSEPLPLHAMQVEIRYGTRGTKELAGMDRGRVLCAMDVELRRMLQPQSAVMTDYSVSPAVVMGTRVFWSEAVLEAATVDGEWLRRRATLTVFALEEAKG